MLIDSWERRGITQTFTYYCCDSPEKNGKDRKSGKYIMENEVYVPLCVCVVCHMCVMVVGLEAMLKSVKTFPRTCQLNSQKNEDISELSVYVCVVSVERHGCGEGGEDS